MSSLSVPISDPKSPTKEGSSIGSPVIGRAVALYDFTARKETELSFTHGDLIDITSDSKDWWRGYLSRNPNSKPLKFPSNYVKRLPAPSEEPLYEMRTVTSPYEATTPDEISIPAGATIEIVSEKEGEDTVTVRCDFRQGLVPKSVVAGATVVSPRSTSPHSPSRPKTPKSSLTVLPFPSESKAGPTLPSPSPIDDHPSKPRRLSEAPHPNVHTSSSGEPSASPSPSPLGGTRVVARDIKHSATMRGTPRGTARSIRSLRRSSIDPSTCMARPAPLQLGFPGLVSLHPSNAEEDEDVSVVVNRLVASSAVEPLPAKGQYESYPFDEPDTDDVLVMEKRKVVVDRDLPTQHETEMTVLAGATMPKIVAYLTSFATKYGLTFTGREKINRNFVICSRMFIQPLELYQLVESRFLSAADADPESPEYKNRSEIQHHVIIFLRDWINTTRASDLKADTSALLGVRTFLRSVHAGAVGDREPLSATLISQAGKVEDMLDLYLKPDDGVKVRAMCITKTLNPFVENLAHFDSEVAEPECVLTINPMEFAQQITLMNHYLFSLITPAELFSQGWTKKEGASKICPNISTIGRFFDQKSKWAEQAILRCKDDKVRQKILEFFITVAENLHEIGDFNGMMMFFGASTQTTIERLKKIWSKKLLKRADDLKTLMDKNFKELRAQQTTHELPCIPFIAVTLTDITYVEDGNPDFYGGDEGKEKKLYNWDKMQFLGDALSKLLKAQQKEFDFTPDSNLIRLIHSMRPIMTDDEAYKRSLEIQPKEKSKK